MLSLSFRFVLFQVFFKKKLDDDDKLKYPVAVVYVLASKFFEAFAANAVRSKFNLFKVALHPIVNVSV